MFDIKDITDDKIIMVFHDFLSLSDNLTQLFICSLLSITCVEHYTLSHSMLNGYEFYFVIYNSMNEEEFILFRQGGFYEKNEITFIEMELQPIESEFAKKVWKKLLSEMQSMI